jgi:hypothetical protein
MSRLSRQCGILNISQPYRSPRPVMGIALLCFTLLLFNNNDNKSFHLHKSLPRSFFPSGFPTSTVYAVFFSRACYMPWRIWSVIWFQYLARNNNLKFLTMQFPSSSYVSWVQLQQEITFWVCLVYLTLHQHYWQAYNTHLLNRHYTNRCMYHWFNNIKTTTCAGNRIRFV